MCGVCLLCIGKYEANRFGVKHKILARRVEFVIYSKYEFKYPQKLYC